MVLFLQKCGAVAPHSMVLTPLSATVYVLKQLGCSLASEIGWALQIRCADLLRPHFLRLDGIFLHE